MAHQVNIEYESYLRIADSVSADVHDNIWRRFISAEGVLYDYVGLNGEVMLPTPQECAELKPNALAWWSPIEDGAFFTGDYLLGLLQGFHARPNDTTRAEIRRLVAGLYHLQDVCRTPGVIARGVGADGQCHYPASSNDQCIPWILALWEYQSSEIPSEPERQDCRLRIQKHIEAIRDHGWILPGDQAGFERGSFLYFDGLEGCLSSVHLALVTKLLALLDGDDSEQLHIDCMDTPQEGGQTRRQLIAEGFTSIEWDSRLSWFSSHAQFAVRLLYRLEQNQTHKALYLQALQRMGNLAAVGVLRYQAFDTSQEYTFTPDWRCMLECWEPQASSAEAEVVAMRELALWAEASPAIKAEKGTLLHAIPAAWIVMMSQDDALIEKWLPEIIEAINHFDYDRIYYGALFFVENVVQEIRAWIGQRQVLSIS
ncbi:hypothetical protein SH580_03090 [Coraliomargarita algicola]|uniref:Uncharacterized protein n=1 Tax=Coraliomargarita algicola TaxID=3092156 RepID=A0ABZ0RNJ5_9BACT|nr:hypothetical protein [Coraliomargarita sp. J2-16]WPJ96688.1 hypothetical protein SH580_03090 [Coraliomargarita sp. J2-16]